MIEDKKWYYTQAVFDFEDPIKAKDKVVTARIIEALNLETTRDCEIELQGRVIRVNSQSLSRISSHFQAMFGGSFSENKDHTLTLIPTDDNMPAFGDLKAVDKFTTDGFVKHSSFEKVSELFGIDNIKISNKRLKMRRIKPQYSDGFLQWFVDIEATIASFFGSDKSIYPPSCYPPDEKEINNQFRPFTVGYSDKQFWLWRIERNMEQWEDECDLRQIHADFARLSQSDGPTGSITEIALYIPSHDESFESLIPPYTASRREEHSASLVDQFLREMDELQTHNGMDHDWPLLKRECKRMSNMIPKSWISIPQLIDSYRRLYFWQNPFPRLYEPRLPLDLKKISSELKKRRLIVVVNRFGELYLRKSQYRRNRARMQLQAKKT